MRSRSRAAVLTLSLATAACAAPATRATTAVAPRPRPLPNDVRWFRTSAEYRAIALQTYRDAESHLGELARGLDAGRWAVILDADETVIDNSAYQRGRALVDSGYTDASWVAWVRERAAVAVPGAVEFTRAVQARGGRVAIVTNRADSLCAPTRDNLASVGVRADILLCQSGRESDKNPRFHQVQAGDSAHAMPPLTVVAWVGDNIQDFPALTQRARDTSDALAAFGTRYFILPNPMYGSWERNPDR